MKGRIEMLKSSDLSPDLRKRLGIKEPSKYKVSAKDTRTCDGITFDSKKEMHRYRTLKGMQAQGLIKYFLRRVPFHLPGGVKYLADFLVVYKDREPVVEDVKGVKTAMYILKKKQVREIYGVEIQEL
jgi:hypothetical protein